MDVDVAVPTGAVVGLFAVEPEDAGEDKVLFLHRVGGFPDAAGGLASINPTGISFLVSI